MSNRYLIQLALPLPMRRVFDYWVSGDVQVEIGCRVLAPFGTRKLVGVAISRHSTPNYDESKIKAILQVLDDTPVFNTAFLKWLQWGANYYQHSIGEVFSTALPVLLRKGQSTQRTHVVWKATPAGDEELNQLKRSPKQLALYQKLVQGPLPDCEIKQDFSSQILKSLREKGLISPSEVPISVDDSWCNQINIAPKPKLNLEQSLAVTAITRHSDSFNSFLLEGVTGSGKTEVYLQGIEPILKQGKQVLILVPEIGLTPQTVARFEHRFGIKIGLLHSGVNDSIRLNIWQQAQSGELGLIIGTRSAIFTPLKNPGMLIVDEEHDSSYKQQDGWRYHARDMAVVRAQQLDIPLILGSATPSLETLNNAICGKYQHLTLNKRAGEGQQVHHQLMDIKGQELLSGVAKGLLPAVQHHLNRGNQVLFFINRRGYAPCYLCHDCGHVEMCNSCDRPFTYHKSLNKLQCHHCGNTKPIPRKCGNCGSCNLESQGIGTEQLEAGLTNLFPAYKAIRIDSDSSRGKDKLNNILEQVNQGHYQVLIGTQILAKGHHFPKVAMVVILDVDASLFSADFRAGEKLAQLITQVAGRAGRENIKGELWLQSHHPGHPLLQDLLLNGYGHFSRLLLTERKYTHLPPFSYQALFRAESVDGRQANNFLLDVMALLNDSQLMVIGPLPALMERRQGRIRMQLILQTHQRTLIQKTLTPLLPHIELLPLAKKVRWSLDIDPTDMN